MKGSRVQGFEGSRVVRAQRARLQPLGPSAPRPLGPLAPRSLRPSAPWPLGPSAFTLVEVLIVIVVISLLIAVIGTVSVKVMHGQKVALTQTIMRNTKMAIDRFAEADPLRNIYNRKGNVTFGPYAPYTLANAGVGVASVVEPIYPANLEVRLSRDLSGDASLSVPNDYVDIHEGNGNDDIRALYAYLAVYARDTLSTIPDAAKKPLPGRTFPPGGPEMVNPAGNGTGATPGDGAIDVLGIHDAWGVPLDYFLYVKLEWDGVVGVWQVTQRIPALRSHGHSREAHEAESDEPSDAEKQNWIFSDPFPSPAARLPKNDEPTLPVGSAQNAGWVRARAGGDPANQATWDDYDYVP